MDTSSLEELENIRRMAERGRKFCLADKDSVKVDIFQHIIDLTEWIQLNEKTKAERYSRL